MIRLKSFFQIQISDLLLSQLMLHIFVDDVRHFSVVCGTKAMLKVSDEFYFGDEVLVKVSIPRRSVVKLGKFTIDLIVDLFLVMLSHEDLFIKTGFNFCLNCSFWASVVDQFFIYSKFLFTSRL